MSEERKKILNMLSGGKISVDEAERLLTALSETKETTPHGEPIIVPGNRKGGVPKYLYVSVLPKEGRKGERVNVRVPLGLIKAGMKFASLIPNSVQDKVSGAMEEKGIDFDLSNLNMENVDELLEAFRELQVDVDSDDEIVKVYCE